MSACGSPGADSYDCTALNCCRSELSGNKDECFAWDDPTALYKYDVFSAVEDECPSLEFVQCLLRFDPRDVSSTGGECLSLMAEECRDESPSPGACHAAVQAYQGDFAGVEASRAAACTAVDCLASQRASGGQAEGGWGEAEECGCAYAESLCGSSDPPDWFDCGVASCCTDFKGIWEDGVAPDTSEFWCLAFASPFLPDHHGHVSGNDYVCSTWDGNPACLKAAGLGTTCLGEEWDCGTEACDCDGGRAVCDADGTNPCDTYAPSEPSPSDAVCDDEAAARCLASSDPVAEDGGCAAAVRDACDPSSPAGPACLAGALGPPPPDGSLYPLCGLRSCLDLGRTAREDCLCDYVVSSCSGDGKDFIASAYDCDEQAECCASSEGRAACFEGVDGAAEETVDPEAAGEGTGDAAGGDAAAEEDASVETGEVVDEDAGGGTPSSTPTPSSGISIQSSLLPVAATLLLFWAL